MSFYRDFYRSFFGDFKDFLERQQAFYIFLNSSSVIAKLEKIKRSKDRSRHRGETIHHPHHRKDCKDEAIYKFIKNKFKIVKIL